MLEFFLFGPFRFHYNGTPQPFAALPRANHCWPICCSTVAQPVLRTTLAYTLWPTVDEATARTNLRRHLYEVRRVLPPAPADQPWLLADNRTVQWNPQVPCTVDVEAFLSQRSAPDTLAAAVALYRADLLPNLDEEWLFFRREELRNYLLADLGQLVAHHQAQQEYATAAGYAQQLLQHDPLREEMVRTLMRLRYAQGDRAGALAEYQRFAQRLRHELAVAPMVETNALYDSFAQETNNQPSRSTLLEPATTTSAVETVPTVPPHNLPAQLTSFIGREPELAALRALLCRQVEPVRLLTLTGPGGSGKTRLALEAASRLLADTACPFPDGVYVVMLSTVRDPALLPVAIGATLAIKERPAVSLWESLKAALQDKQMLLILDNFEQMLTAAPALLELLMAAPRLHLLVTSRARLQLYGEQEFVVPPLPLPDLEEPLRPERLAHYAAIKLFLTRSRAVNPTVTFTRDNAATIAEICVRLDGLPLTLELAAARSKLFTPSELLARLSNSLAFLTDRDHRLEARHQTLRATLDWSYHLLTPAEQRLFARLAVFARGFTLAAVESVCALNGDLDVLEGFTALVNNSLVRRVAAAEEMRFLLLVTVRDYAWAQLPTAEVRLIQQQHAAYYLRWVEAAPQALYAGQQLTWLNRLHQDEDNLRTALHWAFLPDADVEQIEIGLRITRSSAAFGRSMGGSVRPRTGLRAR
ncbi:MAG: BTAD domain-containing putative transcriptional regulator [Caldilineaceae bacterium]